MMFTRLVVPVDESSTSLDAVRVATDLAAAVDGSVEVVTVVGRRDDVDGCDDELRARLAGLGPLRVQPTALVRVGGSVADVIAERLDATPGAMVLMSSHGHGRSASVLGSTTDEILHEVYGPVIVVGPNAAMRAGAPPAMPDGTYIVPLDGSARADGVLPIVGAWSVEFGGTPCLLEVIDALHVTPLDDARRSVVADRARDLHRQIHRKVEFEALHGLDVAGAIVDFADRRSASLIFMATHGRTGFERLRAGSVTAGVVRHASCPVVLFRPPEFAVDEAAVAAGSRLR
jgi:nucleotide-binding universal stress UspA family protein